MDIDGPVSLQEELSIPGSTELCQAWWKGACEAPDLVPCPEPGTCAWGTPERSALTAWSPQPGLSGVQSFGRHSLVIASCRIPRSGCSAAAPGGGMADAVHAGRIQSGSSRVPVTLAQMAELQLGRVGRRLLLSPRHRCPLSWEGGERDVSIFCPADTAMAWGGAALSCSSVRSAASTGEGNCRQGWC